MRSHTRAFLWPKHSACCQLFTYLVSSVQIMNHPLFRNNKCLVCFCNLKLHSLLKFWRLNGKTLIMPWRVSVCFEVKPKLHVDLKWLPCCCFTLYKNLLNKRSIFCNIINKISGPDINCCSHFISSHGSHPGIIDTRKLKGVKVRWPLVAWCWSKFHENLCWFKSY
jgi:hypothetical protein